jgi:hypothetical protein
MVARTSSKFGGLFALMKPIAIALTFDSVTHLVAKKEIMVMAKHIGSMGRSFPKINTLFVVLS